MATARRKPASIRTLWAIAKSPELGMTDENLHALVERETGKASMKKLTQGEINSLARVLQNMKDSAGGRTARRRTDSGGNAQTVELRRKIYRLMQTLGWNESQVNGLARRMCHVDRVEWLEPAQCSKLIEALKAIAARKEKEAAGNDTH